MLIIMKYRIQLHKAEVSLSRERNTPPQLFPHHSFSTLQTTVNVVADRVLEESALFDTLDWPLNLRTTLATHLRQILEISSHRREIQQLHRSLIIGNRQPGSALLDSLSGGCVAKNLEELGWRVRVKSADERGKVAALKLHRLEVVGITKRLEVSLQSHVSKLSFQVWIDITYEDPGHVRTVELEVWLLGVAIGVSRLDWRAAQVVGIISTGSSLHLVEVRCLECS
jgi:hypothetical protein